ncbi:MAG: ATP-binding protein [Terriglobales bacterium]
MSTPAHTVSETAQPTAALLSAIARVRSLVEQYATTGTRCEAPATDETSEASPLALMCERFELSPFERDLLVLCAAVEVDPAMPILCVAVNHDDDATYPTFHLALQALPNPHWSALMPDGALRRFKLLHVHAGDTLTGSRLRIDESVLHFLMGAPSMDRRLQAILEPVRVIRALPASYRAVAEAITAAITCDEPAPAVVQLEGNAGKGKRTLAAASCASLGLHLYSVNVATLASPAEQDEFVSLWERDALLNGCAILLQVPSGNAPDWITATRLADRIGGVVLVNGSGALELVRKRLVRIRVDRPGTDEQRALFRHALGEYALPLNGELNAIAAHFPLDVESITCVSARAVESVRRNGADLVAALWNECRAEARPTLDGRVQRIDARANWEDVVLPDSAMETLRSIAVHIRQHETVFRTWGFAAQNSRGVGLSALFCGQSGTGKTLASEVLANELHVDLYRIDLSQIVSKYIGETEKNLCAIFDAAENSGAILLFDEADALFGKRSEVHDSHDRYANVEVSYLLQRMETYAGLAVMTTNMRQGIDPAFLRRIRFVINFPFPDPSLRRRIWQRVFPANTPIASLFPEKLAKLNLPGGNIRNIALHAAFLAADAGGAVTMEHLLIAARRECAKLERPLSDAEVGNWV